MREARPKIVAFLLLWWCCLGVLRSSYLGVDGLAAHQHHRHHDDQPSTHQISRRDCLSAAAAGCWSSSFLLSEKSNAFAVAAPAPTAPTPITAPFLTQEALLDKGVTRPEAGRSYFPTLTPPFWNRATVRYDLGRRMWALEQLLAFGNVTATIRTTVVQMAQSNSNSNGNGNDDLLWVHSPQWPTGEFCALLDELPGRVAHIVLPCNALEHKAPMKDFCRRYPSASVWIAPGQYGPFGSCGETFDPVRTSKSMGYRVDGILTSKNAADGTTAAATNILHAPSWGDEFEYATLQIDLPQNAGPVTEVAFWHKPTQTLIATDATVFVPRSLQQSTLYETYFDAATVQNDPTFWPRTVLQSVFLPLRYVEKDNDGDTSSSSSGYPGFDAIADRLVRAPILRGFNDARGRDETVEWVNFIAARWKFDRIVTSHFASPVVATPGDFRSAFAYLYNDNDDTATAFSKQQLPPIACRDWELLDSLNQVIAQNKLGAPATFDYKQDCRRQ